MTLEQCHEADLTHAPWSSTEADDDVRRVRYQIEIGPYWANGSSGPVSAVCTDTAAGASCLTTLARPRASSSSLAPRTRNFQRRLTGRPAASSPPARATAP